MRTNARRAADAWNVRNVLECCEDGDESQTFVFHCKLPFKARLRNSSVRAVESLRVSFSHPVCMQRRRVCVSVCVRGREGNP